METVSCDLCGSRDYRLYLRSRDYINRCDGIFSVVQCKKCGLLFTNPRPDKTEISRFYPPSTHYYVVNIRGLEPMKAVTGLYRTLLHYFRGYFPEKDTFILYKVLLYPVYLLKRRKFDAEAIPYFVKNGRLLEIGCSHGKFLHEMKTLGWNVTGIDMSREAVEKGREIFGIDLTQKDIDDAVFEEDSFDVIVMRMVLEHVYSPDKILRKLKTWLKPGGRLIVVVPDISGFEARLFGKYFYGLHLPNHFYHFTPETLKKYFGKQGMEIYGIAHQRTDKDFYQSIENVFSDNKSLFFLRMLRFGFFKIFVRFFIALLSKVYKTGRMTVFAMKGSGS